MSDPTSPVAKRVLIVDDNPDICAFMQAALEAAGYEVRTAPEGAQALAMLERRTVDLIITDIFMPGQEGFATITRCRAEFPLVKIMVMSAGSVPGMKHDFLAAAALLNVAATLRKPFTADQLLDAVGGALQPR
jgi:CheY-like chemotaxis protein